MDAPVARFVLDRVGSSRPPDAPVVAHTAIKAVVQADGKLLVVATNEGDVKFPGGGKETGESDRSCLVRELAEECGAVVASVGSLVCEVTERRPDRDGESVFEMVSRYWTATVTDEVVAQQLNEYEARLGMTPAWVTPVEALAANVAHLRSRPVPAPWVHREVTVLAHLLSRPREETGQT